MPHATMIDAFTWQDFQQLPQGNLRYEILDGELVVSPAPDTRHQRLLRGLVKQFQCSVQDAGLGEVLFAPFDIKLSNTDVYEPDLLVILKQNLGRITETHLDGPPDLAVEIVSPGSARRDRGRKKDRYELHGVPEYWVVDPRANFVDQHILDHGRYLDAGRFTDAVDLHVLPGVCIDLRPVW